MCRLIVSGPEKRNTLASQALKRACRAAAAVATALLPTLQPAHRFVRARSFALGGHVLRECTNGWRCMVCRILNSSWNAIVSKRCARSAALIWASLSAHDTAGEREAKPHRRWLSDDTMWCSVCGQYATEAVYGLKRGCRQIRPGTKNNLR